MPNQDQASALIESAARLFHRQGYGATGAREIAVAAGVPQGSFTNHFRSKEALATAALDSYVARLTELMRATLDDRTCPAKQRLLAYFDLIAARLADAGWERGCMIPDLATEASAFGETLRSRLVDVLREQSAAFETVLRELLREADAGDMAGFVVAAWHGSLLRMKAERSAEAVDRFRRVLDRLLPA